MKKILFLFLLLSASALSVSAATLSEASVFGKKPPIIADPDDSLPRWPSASYYHVQLEPGFSINVFCYSSRHGSQIEVECNEPIDWMSAMNLNTGEGAVTRAHGSNRAIVNVSDYHGRWEIFICMPDGTEHVGEVVL